MVIRPHIVVTVCVIVPFLTDVISGCIQFELVHILRCPISWNLSIEVTLVHEYGVLVPDHEVE